MAMEKNGRIRDNAFENWASATQNLQNPGISQGEWTVRLWGEESAPLASAGMGAKQRLRGPNLSARMAGGFQDEPSGETIYMGRINTMLYL